ncbi:hypothetical protein QQF64_035096 [Cirrhinus molitorella]|uniref:Uncharacterized protein n=1 Tax=Cirrhinus molitorella TaxID=172907 RepID=A0ABR3NET3_9TELE
MGRTEVFKTGHRPGAARGKPDDTLTDTSRGRSTHKRLRFNCSAEASHNDTAARERKCVLGGLVRTHTHRHTNICCRSVVNLLSPTQITARREREKEKEREKAKKRDRPHITTASELQPKALCLQAGELKLPLSLFGLPDEAGQERSFQSVDEWSKAPFMLLMRLWGELGSGPPFSLALLGRSAISFTGVTLHGFALTSPPFPAINLRPSCLLPL